MTKVCRSFKVLAIMLMLGLSGSFLVGCAGSRPIPFSDRVVEVNGKGTESHYWKLKVYFEDGATDAEQEKVKQLVAHFLEDKKDVKYHWYYSPDAFIVDFRTNKNERLNIPDDVYDSVKEMSFWWDNGSIGLASGWDMGDKKVYSKKY